MEQPMLDGTDPTESNANTNIFNNLYLDSVGTQVPVPASAPASAPVPILVSVSNSATPQLRVRETIRPSTTETSTSASSSAPNSTAKLSCKDIIKPPENSIASLKAIEVASLADVFPEIYSSICDAIDNDECLSNILRSLTNLKESYIAILNNDDDGDDEDYKLQKFIKRMLKDKKYRLSKSLSDIDKQIDNIINRIFDKYTGPLKKYFEIVDPNHAGYFKSSKIQFKQDLILHIDKQYKTTDEYNNKIYEIIEQDIPNKTKLSNITRIVIFE